MHISMHDFWPPALPINQDRVEVRIYAGAMTLLFFGWSMEAAVAGALIEQSPLYKIVSLTHYPLLMLSAFFLAALAVIPHLVSLIAIPSILTCRWPRLIAFYGSCFSSVLWFYFANCARPLDYGELPYLYVARALMCMVVASVFAFSLNAQQLRSRIDV